MGIAKDEIKSGGKSVEQLYAVPFNRDSGDSRRGVETERKNDKNEPWKLDVDRVKNQTGQHGSALANLKTPSAQNQKTPASNSFAVSISQEENVEIWKLRCKLLAEKYFKTLKDIK